MTVAVLRLPPPRRAHEATAEAWTAPAEHAANDDMTTRLVRARVAQTTPGESRKVSARVDIGDVVDLKVNT
tara:strand:+ start:4250 stop:4462 length:213 start_codon:yes stop_codon:yes gene_type:complete